MEKKFYSTVQVRETNTFWHLRVGEVFLYKLQKFTECKSDPATPSFTNTVHSIDLKWNDEYTHVSWW